ncbi:glycosyltransferase [Candidatus Peregrinibacteria bacterium]|nr:glycosyltransferase [Candidatus Peregrinibacteria bacterium]
MTLKEAKIAIVCDWLTNFAGAERVILKLHKMFPAAPIYTSVYNEKKMPEFKNAVIHTSFIQQIPKAKEKHQLFLKLYPVAFEQFDLSGYDIVISSCHSCSKGIITKPETMHVCYCHSPMRYAWDNSHEYLRTYKMHGFLKRFVPKLMNKIRIWDRLAADRVDFFATNSNFVKKRIKKYYKHDAQVIYPMVNTNEFYISNQDPKKYYLAVGRFTPYKRFDLIVDAFNELPYKLKIVGTGLEENELKKRARTNIEFLGHVSETSLKDLYANCKALIFPQIEDFGITPLEAMASGRPVVAFNKGGALETVINNQTGIFFNEQNVISLKAAVEKCEKTKWNSKTIRQHAMKFDEKVFEKDFNKYLETQWNYWQKTMR